MHKPFIPNRDADFSAWLGNFEGLIAADPAAYGLSAGDAAALSSAAAAWNDAFDRAASRTTRSAVDVLAKNQARDAAVAVVRRLAALIRPNGAVSDDLKRGLGLRVRAGSLTRARPPAAPPTLCVEGFDLGSHAMLARGFEDAATLAKPRGAATLLVVRAVGDEPVKSPDQAAFLTIATRTRFTSRFSAKDSGRVATYFARWANARGELGPWSGPVSARIAA